MLVLLPLLLVAVLISMWLIRRNSTLTRDCRWRLDRSEGAGAWHCVACGARMQAPQGQSPRQCLRPQEPPGD